MKMNLGGRTFSFPNMIEFLMIYFDLFVLQSYKEVVKGPRVRILDCGAHIGIATLYYKSVYPQAHITCFEPNPASIAFLKENISQNNLDTIDVVPAAVWNTDGTISFSHSMWSWGDHVRTDATNNTFEVKSTRLLKYLQEPVDILKIDIEGAEEAVIKDIDPYLKNVQAIVMEYHSNLKPLPNDLHNISAILKKNDFEIKFGYMGRIVWKLRQITHIPFPFFLVIHAHKIKTS